MLPPPTTVDPNVVLVASDTKVLLPALFEDAAGSFDTVVIDVFRMYEVTSVVKMSFN